MGTGRVRTPPSYRRQATSLPTWAIYAVSFGAPLAAFVGVLIGHLLTRRGAHELDRRATREEAMRMLRWASELAASDDSGRATLRIAALDALSSSPWLHDEDQKLIDAVLDSLLVEDAQAYREATGAQVVEIEPYRGSAEGGKDLPAPEGGAWS